jgi:two-component system nitrate/nitrite response regulator NarL
MINTQVSRAPTRPDFRSTPLATETLLSPITVVIADDDPDLRRLLRENISLDRRFELLLDACDGQSGLDGAIAVQPDLLILDLMMPGVNGAEVLEHMRIRCPRTKVAMYTGATADIAARLTGDRADLYIRKGEILVDLLDRLVLLVHGEMTPAETPLVVRLPVGPQPVPPPPPITSVPGGNQVSWSHKS